MCFQLLKAKGTEGLELHKPSFSLQSPRVRISKEVRNLIARELLACGTGVGIGPWGQIWPIPCFSTDCKLKIGLTFFNA